MATSDYIPAEDAQFQVWAVAFAAAMVANYGLYSLSQAEAQSIKEAVDDFVAKFAISSSEATRTKGSVANKNEARNVAEVLCRQYAMQIKDNLGIPNAAKIAAGVRPINPTREPIECPQSWPVLNVLGNTPGVQTLKYIDSVTEKGAKPFGATELQLMVAVTDEGEGPLEQAKFQGKFTRNPIAVPFTEADDGKVATYYARWVSARGEHGPWSLPASMRIAA